MSGKSYSLLKAVERMRERQKERDRTRAPSAAAAARKSEREVDGIVRLINEAGALELQPELTGGEA